MYQMNSWKYYISLVYPSDLFRYASKGVRSYSYSAKAAYFSIDNGVTNLVDFNNINNGADKGDWAVGSPAQVPSIHI